MTKQSIPLQSDFITLGQVLKQEGIIGTGGQAKWYLAEHQVQVNQERETRRGRKLYPGDQICILDEPFEAEIVPHAD